MAIKKHCQKLIVLIIIYGISLLFAGYWSPYPNLVGIVGFFLGILAFSIVFTTRLDGKLLDLSIFATSIAGSALGTILLFFCCYIQSKPVCLPNAFRAQILGNFAFPLFGIIALWLSRRLPVILKKDK